MCSYKDIFIFFLMSSNCHLEDIFYIIAAVVFYSDIHYTPASCPLEQQYLINTVMKTSECKIELWSVHITISWCFRNKGLLWRVK